MSYIRCLSNPEGLYIFDDGKNMNFAIGDKLQIIPSGYFNSFITAYLKKENAWREDDFTWGKISIKEVFVLHKKKPDDFQKFLKVKPGSYKYELRYNGKLIARMWHVTWCYIVNNFRQERA